MSRRSARATGRGRRRRRGSGGSGWCFPAGHTFPIMSRVLLGHQAVPELVAVVKMAMVPLRIAPEVRFCAMANSHLTKSRRPRPLDC